MPKTNLRLILSIILLTVLLFMAIAFRNAAYMRYGIELSPLLPSVTRDVMLGTPPTSEVSNPNNNIIEERHRVTHNESVFRTYPIPNSKNVVELIYKDEFVGGEGTSTEEFIRIKYANGTAKEIYHLEPSGLPSSIEPENISISPAGGYLTFTIGYWEGIEKKVIDLKTLKNILPPEVSPVSILWAPDESILVIYNLQDHMGILGMDSLLVSDLGNPSKLHVVFKYDGRVPEGEKNNGNLSVKELKDINIMGVNVYFTAVDYNKGDIKFVYNVPTKTISQK